MKPSFLDQLLILAAQRHASDLLLVANSPAALRVNGALSGGIGQNLSPAELRSILLPILTSDQVAELQTQKSLDFCFVRKAIGRFRANYHYQRGTLAASIRLLPEQIPSLESLHLSPALALLSERRQGLMLRYGADRLRQELNGCRPHRPDQQPPT
jgi:twitching motility protein PilT